MNGSSMRHTPSTAVPEARSVTREPTTTSDEPTPIALSDGPSFAATTSGRSTSAAPVVWRTRTVHREPAESGRQKASCRPPAGRDSMRIATRVAPSRTIATFVRGVPRRSPMGSADHVPSGRRRSAVPGVVRVTPMATVAPRRSASACGRTSTGSRSRCRAGARTISVVASGSTASSVSAHSSPGPGRPASPNRSTGHGPGGA